jgi:hypothetical protein
MLAASVAAKMKYLRKMIFSFGAEPSHGSPLTLRT